MKSYKSSSVTDENELNQHIKPKTTARRSIGDFASTSASSSHLSGHREALSDVTTQENKHSYRVKHAQPNHTISHHHTTSSTSASKIQIYQQQDTSIHQFKKPRLEKVLLKNDHADEEATDDELDQYEEDEEDKENRYIDLELNDDDSKNQLISEAFDTIDDKRISELDHHHVVVEEDLDDFEEEETHQILHPHQQQNHIPMKPIWSNSCVNEVKYVIQKYSRTTLDEDDEDTYDATMVAEYAPEIFNYLHELEHKYTPDGYYMENQTELKWEMRSVLMDWVVQVHARFNLLPETLFLTVNYIDRFLSKRQVSLTRFQLVGAVALFIAAKYEEINCPTVQEVAFMADNAYPIEDLLKAERFMIDVLDFDMGWPGPMSFLRRISKADNYDYETRTLAKYFLEITIMDSRFVASPPSWLAAGAHYLSRKLLGRGDWTELHVFYSGFTERQVRPLAEILLENCRYAEKNHKAIFDKYKERRYRKSALFVQDYFNSLMSP
ncbi:G2/mitotic-specific cyclin-4 [Candida viswanathii]|uniref:G2/mitotic-specific cyclin-4 n=1 Tax=Candida viswanathii TaxID=5486 RepID=A0A367YKW3_9ASCO|nr:G2/mitotic-specific cyclin-4 [Candida viswanathii]